MFLLVTGLPGSGKTSHVIDKFFDEKRRPIFYCSVPITEQGREKLPWSELTPEEVKDWPNHLPAEGILIVDECQRLFPVRPTSKPVPDALTALETHRHLGVDIVFITQDPGLLDSHARKLVNEHIHYSRPFGAPFAVEYHSGSGVISPKSKTDLAGCTQRKKRLPKRVFDLYKSAEVHTHKFRPPKIFYILPILLAATAYFFYTFVSDFHDMAPDAPGTPQAHAAETASPGQTDSTGQFGQDSHRDELEDMDWLELLTPEVEGIPYSAPIYRERALDVKSVPRVAGCAAIRDLCRCYTQQGTRVTMDESVCRAYLDNPPFDHMRTADTRQQTRERREQPRARTHSGRAVLLPGDNSRIWK